MKTFISHSAEETKKIAAEVASNITSGVIALIGNLGSGKTTFAQGFARSLGIKEKIISPTFVLIRQYIIPKTKKTFYHIDLYRLEYIKDLESLGLKEILSNPDNIVLIEWAEKARDIFPLETLCISFKTKDDQTREIKFPS